MQQLVIGIKTHFSFKLILIFLNNEIGSGQESETSQITKVMNSPTISFYAQLILKYVDLRQDNLNCFAARHKKSQT